MCHNLPLEVIAGYALERRHCPALAGHQFLDYAINRWKGLLKNTALDQVVLHCLLLLMVES